MDLSDTIQPVSDQLDAIDLLTGPRTFTIERVTKGNGEQPVNIYLKEFPRPWRPGKSMRRVLVACWSADASSYVGRRVRLFCDPSVRFGGEEVGGTRISHLSHIDKPRTIPLLITRGRSAPYKVHPLPDDAPTVPSVSAETLAELRALFTRKGIAEEAQLPGVNRIIGGSATSVEVITEQEAQRVIAALRKRRDVAATDAQDAPSGVDPATGEVPGYDPNDPSTHPDYGKDEPEGEAR